MSQFRLYRNETGLCLRDTFSMQRPLQIDYATPRFVQRLQQAGRKSELIVRAIKPRTGMRLLDCTAGLAREAFLLAHLGCEVTLLERSPVIAALIGDALQRAEDDPFLKPAVSRMNLKNVDAVDYLKMTGLAFDVIYIDPMFPEKSGSAAVGGEMQLLQRFLGVDEDAAALVTLALSAEVSRVVLKRPARSDWRPPTDPVHVFAGKNSRYELFGA